jgi:hypothetical protein
MRFLTLFITAMSWDNLEIALYGRVPRWNTKTIRHANTWLSELFETATIRPVFCMVMKCHILIWGNDVISKYLKTECHKICGPRDDGVRDTTLHNEGPCAHRPVGHSVVGRKDRPRWVGHVAQMRKAITEFKILVGNQVDRPRSKLSQNWDERRMTLA